MSDAARLTPETLLAHEAFVLRLARSLVRDEAAADDLAQETWLSALESPPRPGPVRAWLARVTRNHALNAVRAKSRRDAREAAAARPEAVDPGPSASERLELQQAVVRAVLELEEPLRGAVIAVYYEGATPTGLARARGVPAGTVRSWLSRGLDRVRDRLDREHGGDRSAWALALVGLAGCRRAPPLAGGGLGAGGWLAWLGAAAVIAVVAWRVAAVDAETETVPIARLAQPAGRAAEENREPATAAGIADGSGNGSRGDRGAAGAGRTAIAPAAAELPRDAAPATAPADDGGEARALAERALWIKDRVLSGRAAVDPALVRATSWTEGRDDAGIVRLVDHSVFEDRLDVPWLAGGASTWSFTERTLDARSHGQIRLEQQGLGVPSAHGGKGVVIDLGRGDLHAFALDPHAALAGLDERTRAAWSVGLRTLTVEPGMERLELQRALRELRLDDEVEPEPGHVYLVRAFRPEAFDVAALVEPLQVDDEACTLAWALLETRPVSGARPAPAARDAERSALEPQPDLERLDETALLRELETVEARIAALVAAAADTGVSSRSVRVLDERSPLARTHAPDAEPWLFSFATGRHGWRRSEPDLKLSDGSYSMDFNVRSISWFQDLGAIALDDAELVAAERFRPEWELLSGATLPHFVPQAERVAAQAELQRRAAGTRLSSRVAAHVGHVYLVRSIYPSWHDHLVAFRVDERSELGDLLSWRVLSTWPVERR